LVVDLDRDSAARDPPKERRAGRRRPRLGGYWESLGCATAETHYARGCRRRRFRRNTLVACGRRALTSGVQRSRHCRPSRGFPSRRAWGFRWQLVRQL